MRPPELSGLAGEDVFAVAYHAIASVELKPVIGFIHDSYAVDVIIGCQREEPSADPEASFVRVSFERRIGNREYKRIIDAVWGDFESAGRSRERDCA